MGGTDYMTGLLKMLGGAEGSDSDKIKTAGISGLSGFILGFVVAVIIGLLIYMLVLFSGDSFAGRRRQRTGGMVYKGQSARLEIPDHSGPIDPVGGNSWQGQEPEKLPSMRDMIEQRPVDNFFDVDEAMEGCGCAPFTGDRQHRFADSLKDMRPVDYLQEWDGELTQANADFVLASNLYTQ